MPLKQATSRSEHAMTYRGHLQNGVVVIDEPTDLPDGAEVEVHPLARVARGPEGARPCRTLAEVLGPVIGKAKGLPPDAAVNLEHYLYGRPKQKP
jgi:hypothetical protein